MQDHLDVENKLSNLELQKIIGGTNINNSLITTLINSTFKVVYTYGQSFGTSIRRIISNNLCGLQK